MTRAGWNWIGWDCWDGIGWEGEWEEGKAADEYGGQGSGIFALGPEKVNEIVEGRGSKGWAGMGWDEVGREWAGWRGLMGTRGGCGVD